MTTALMENQTLFDGIYPNVPEDVYHSWDLCSYSRLKTLIQETPAVLREQMDHPHPPSAAMTLGSVLDCNLLTPADFEKRFVVPDMCDAKKKDGDLCGNPGKLLVGGHWRCGVHGKEGFADGRELINSEDMARVVGMRDAILLHPKACKLLRTAGENQLSAIVTESETGIGCKLRADRFCPSIKAVIDIKKTRAGFARPDRWQRELVRRGYHFQGVMYTRLLNALSLEVNHFIHIVVEEEPPYQVAVYRLFPDADTTDRIWRQLIKGMETYRECREGGVWPAYANDIQDLDLSAWDSRQLSD